MKPHKKSESKNRGSAILEYTIVFPLVLLVLFALFYMGFVLHQKAVLDSAVSRGTIEAARLLSDPQYKSVTAGAGGTADSLDFSNNSYNFSSSFSIEPYRYIFKYSDDGGKAAIEGKVKEIIAANSLWGIASNVTVNYDYKNFVLYQEVFVTAEQHYPLPGVFRLVGLDDEIVLKTYAVQAVTDPDEVIRNVDLTLDLIDTAIAAMGGADAKGIRDHIGDVTGKINEFATNLFGGK